MEVSASKSAYESGVTRVVVLVNDSIQPYRVCYLVTRRLFSFGNGG